MTKTIVLTKEGGRSGLAEYDVIDIQEYFYEGGKGELGNIAWEQGSENLFVLGKKDGVNEYRKIDISKGKVIGREIVEEGPIGNVKIAPGGRYVLYERPWESRVELILYYAGEERKNGLGDAERFFVSWSGNGKNFFFTDAGNTMVQNTEWGFHCYNMENMENWEMPENRVLSIRGKRNEKIDFIADWDGSQIYMLESEVDWLIQMNQEKQTRVNLLPGKAGHIRPIKYAEAGLFVQDGEGNIFLATDLGRKPKTKKVLQTDSEDIYICDKGDHLFVLEREEDTAHLKITSYLLENGQVQEEKLLYKEVYGSKAKAVISQDDTLLAVQSCEPLGEDKCSYKITSLKYNY